MQFGASGADRVCWLNKVDWPAKVIQEEAARTAEIETSFNIKIASSYSANADESRRPWSAVSMSATVQLLTQLA